MSNRVSRCLPRDALSVTVPTSSVVASCGTRKSVGDPGAGQRLVQGACRAPDGVALRHAASALVGWPRTRRPRAPGAARCSGRRCRGAPRRRRVSTVSRPSAPRRTAPARASNASVSRSSESVSVVGVEREQGASAALDVDHEQRRRPAPRGRRPCGPAGGPSLAGVGPRAARRRRGWPGRSRPVSTTSSFSPRSRVVPGERPQPVDRAGAAELGGAETGRRSSRAGSGRSPRTRTAPCRRRRSRPAPARSRRRRG